MARQISKGKCNFCEGSFGKAAMTKHLASCERRESICKAPSGKGKAGKKKIFHLIVEGCNMPEYWIHLDVRADATLEDLDTFLREIWLECCGHMSAFTIQGTRYEGIENEFMEAELMNITIGKVLSPGMKFYHEYDFGSTTELTLKVVSEREGELKRKDIRLLARNDPPSITCNACGKIATQVCCQCIWSGEGWLCDKCAHRHECGEDMFLPVVNSPRVGMCGYTG